MTPAAEQAWRRVTQIGFLTLFVLAPVFDLLRYDMVEKHAYLLTFPWQLGIDDLLAKRIPPAQAVVNIVLRLILPLVVAIAAFIYTTRRWGRIYCGWLCPHFGVVEWLNSLFIRAIGKPTLWESKALPPIEPNGQARIRDWRGWPLGWMGGSALPSHSVGLPMARTNKLLSHSTTPKCGHSQPQ